MSTGGLARGLGRAADRLFGAEDSTVSCTATHCGLLADGLATDAGAVRQTKVAIASELCALTEQLAVLRAAASTTGGTTSLLITQAVATATANIERHYRQLLHMLTDGDGRSGRIASTDTASSTGTTGGLRGLVGSSVDGLDGLAAALSNRPAGEQVGLLAQLSPTDAAAVVAKLPLEQRQDVQVLLDAAGREPVTMSATLDSLLTPGSDATGTLSSTALSSTGLPSPLSEVSSFAAPAVPNVVGGDGPIATAARHAGAQATAVPHRLASEPIVAAAAPAAPSPVDPGPPPDQPSPDQPSSVRGRPASPSPVSVPSGPTDYQHPSPGGTGHHRPASGVSSVVSGSSSSAGAAPSSAADVDYPPARPDRVHAQWAHPTPPSAGVAVTLAPEQADVAAPLSARGTDSASVSTGAPGGSGTTGALGAQQPNPAAPPPAGAPPGVPTAPSGGRSVLGGPLVGAAPPAAPIAAAPAPPALTGTVPPSVGPPRALLVPGLRPTAPEPPPAAETVAGLDSSGSAGGPPAQRATPVAGVVIGGFAAGPELRRYRRPARQLALPAPFVEPRPGLCCPIGDHPNHRGLIDPVFLLSVGAARGRPVVGESLNGSELLAAHDPLGGMHERELYRRFVVRPATVKLPGEYAWPPCELYPEGAADTDLRMSELLPIGTVLDLLGSAAGRVVAAGGTPFARRSLPPEYTERTLCRLVVRHELPVWTVHTAAWFGQPGGGRRHRLTHSVAELVAVGMLVQAVSGGHAASTNDMEPS